MFEIGNKENLVFVGTWTTRNGTKVRVKNSVARIVESQYEYLKGFDFPIDNLGKCSVSPGMDLVERDRTSEGYTR
jgi:hypothetical protein